MRLSPGTRVGAYEVVALIGAGGMGEVYRAVDTGLGRDVAIKVLPLEFSADPERVGRFEREARTLALLNHPNIATVHGYEQATASTAAGPISIPALVMEFVDGPTLADRIAQGRIPADEAIPVARQIAEALEAAHEQGVIHRDLKPANIKLRSDGAVKVLDFGLAKALESGADHRSQANSPTLISPVTMTHAGVILGTAAYMSPEQARGKPVDRRTDIWAFGCVLFEMLAGKRAFDGDEVSDTLAAILRSEPRIADLPADTPLPVRRLVHRCLQKDPRRRLQHIGDGRIELDDVDVFEPTAAPSSTSRVRLWPVLAAAAAGVAATAVAMWLLRPQPVPVPVTRFAIPMDSLGPVSLGTAPRVALSPDGRMVVHGSPSGLLQRRLDSFEFQPIAGAEAARSPFFSPDGAWIAYFSGPRLRKVPAEGGVAITICEAPFGALGAWGPDGTIVVTRDHLYRVPASGGTLTLVLDSGGVPFDEPEFVRESTILVRRGPNSIAPRIEAVELDTGVRHDLIDGATPKVASTGDLLFQRQGAIWATRFDAARLTVLGSPVQLVQAGRRTEALGAMFDAARDGTMIYVSGTSDEIASLVWLDRAGSATPALTEQLAFQSARISPDGKRVAVSIPPDVWVYDLDRGSRIRLTTEGLNRRSVWSPDGAEIAFYSTPPGSAEQDMFAAPSTGGPARRLLAKPGPQYPDAWSRDGKSMIFEDGEQGGASRRDLWLLPTNGEPQALLATRFYERGAVISPNGEWLAFVSDESGSAEVYVQRFPGSGPKVPVSTNGGIQPVWARNGRELFYRQGDMLMTVAVQLQPFRIDAPQKLFEMPAAVYNLDLNFADYDVAPDGRFLAIRNEAARTQEIYVVLNFAEELRRALRR